MACEYSSKDIASTKKKSVLKQNNKYTKFMQSKAFLHGITKWTSKITMQKVPGNITKELDKQNF